LLASSSSSSSSSSSVPPGLPVCCDEIRAKLCLQVWTLDQEEGGEKHGRNWNCFRDWLLRRRNRRDILAPKHAPTPHPPRPHTLSVFTVKNVNPCTTRRACVVVDSLLRLAANRPISAPALTASGLLLRN
jgi:hypothetical protein